jgi:hypothetical protein
VLAARRAFFSFKCLAAHPGKDGREEAKKRREKVKVEVEVEVEVEEEAPFGLVLISNGETSTTTNWQRNPGNPTIM